MPKKLDQRSYMQWTLQAQCSGPVAFVVFLCEGLQLTVFSSRSQQIQLVYFNRLPTPLDYGLIGRNTIMLVVKEKILVVWDLVCSSLQFHNPEDNRHYYSISY